MMSLVHKTKQRLLQSPTFQKVLLSLPGKALDFRKIHSISFEVTSVCNLRCPFCPVGQGKVAKGLMTLEDHKTIIDKIPSTVKRLRYSYRGDPSMNPNWVKMVKYASSKGFYTYVSTNGVVLKRYAKELAESGLHRLMIAIDGATQETLTKYRVGSNIGLIKEGIRLLVEERKKSKTKSPKDIMIQTVISRNNEHEIPVMQELARELGVDRIKFKTLAVKLGEDWEMKGKDEQLDFLPRNKAYWRTGEGVVICPGLSETVILHNGDLGVCCNDYQGKLIYGNLLKQTWEDIFTSPKYYAMRRQMIKKGFTMCKDCSITGEYWIPDISLNFGNTAKK
ncbi:MAG: radical SAM protein [Nitrosarchaeum sp.]|nr:radical SAM protein [Nitrosarchaeum sp.]